MSLLGIAWRTIRQRLFTSLLTSLSLALGVALVVATLITAGVVKRAFASGGGLGYNMIVGAKGSPLQLVLNSVYLISRPIENISWDFYREFLPAAERPDGMPGRYAASVQTAVPICMGDYFRGYRVIGTNAASFDRMTTVDGSPFRFAAGVNFRDDDFFGGVLGHEVARRLGLSVGDTFSPTHGADDGAVHDPFRVTGILARTDTPVDRGVYVNMEGPQFSTRAESRIYRSWGVDVIGMTNLQEAKLAREAELCYTTIAMATDYDCWHEAHDAVTVEQVVAVMTKNVGNAKRLVAALAPKVAAMPRSCGCGSALKHAIMTAKDKIGPQARLRLDLLVGKYL